jgi:hypothetical protein
VSTADKIQLAIAVTTFLAVLVALFGDWIRSKFKFLRPTLVLRLSDRTEGEVTTAFLSQQDGGQPRPERALYHYLAVENPRRVPVATDVRVWLVKIEHQGPDGDFIPVWASEIPVQWHLEQAQRAQRHIGARAEAVLFDIVKDKWLELAPLVITNNVPYRYRVEDGPCHIIATFQARSIETDSNLLRVRIDWTGDFSENPVEMRHHLSFKVV